MTSKITPFGGSMAVQSSKVYPVSDSLTPTGKHKKGSVVVNNYRGRIQLVWRHEGKRYWLSLGVPYLQKHLHKAQTTAHLIESDLAWGTFDESLQKYKPQSTLTLHTTQLGIHDLWTKFVEFKSHRLKPSTMSKKFATYTNHLSRIPHHDLQKVKLVQKYCTNNMSPYASRQFLVRLSACCDWAIQNKLISTNPFLGLGQQVEVGRTQTDEYHIKPFIHSERNVILEAIRTNEFCTKSSGFKHSHYYYFVWLLFNKGCRPSEAVGLEWKHISGDYRFITFDQSVVDTRQGKVLQVGLKTQHQRRFPCNPGVSSVLQEVPKLSETVVFPGQRGGWLDMRSLRHNVWRPVLNGLGIEYRKLYQCRHTFITECLNANVPVTQVASWVGNSPKVIWEHYAGMTDHILPPTL